VRPETNATIWTTASEEQFRSILRDELREALRGAGVIQVPAAPPTPTLLTARETAELLRVDQRTLRRLVHEGSVPPPVRIGLRAIRWDARVLFRALGMEGGAK